MTILAFKLEKPIVAELGYGKEKIRHILDNNPNEYKEIYIDENHKFVAEGDADNLQLYLIIKYKKLLIIQESLKVKNENEFSIDIRFQDNLKNTQFRNIEFISPYNLHKNELKIINSEENSDYKAFQFMHLDNKSSSFECNLTFLLKFATNLDDFSNIPLYVQYIGAIEAENRDATFRLDDKHHKIPAITDNTSDEDSLAVLLYKRADLEYEDDRLTTHSLSKKNINNSIEYTLISKFKSLYNSDGKNFPRGCETLNKELKINKIDLLAVLLSSYKNTNLISAGISEASNTFLTLVKLSPEAPDLSEVLMERIIYNLCTVEEINNFSKNPKFQIQAQTLP